MKIRSDGLAIGLVFVAIGTLACLAPVQSDTWWLLRAGRDIWATGRIPFTDTYSHTASGGYWWNHEWLSEAIFYGVVRAGGLKLLTVVSATAIVVTWMVCWRMTRGGFETRFLGITLSLVPAAVSWAIRPQIFSMLLFALLCWVLIETDERSRSRMWLPPLIVTFWINLHGAAVLALPALAGAAAGELWHRRRIPWPTVIALGGSALAICASPVGIRMYTDIAASMERSRTNMLIEWMPPGLAAAFWPFWALVAAVVIVIVAMLSRLRSCDLRTARLLGIAFAVLPIAVRASRNVQPFLLAGLPAVTSALAGPPRQIRYRREREHLNAAILAGVTVLAAVAVAFVWRRPPPGMGWHPISDGAVRAIEQCPGRLFNTYRDGGVLIWFAPDRPVFVDNRQDPYSDDVLRQSRAIENGAPYAEAFEKYSIACAAVTTDSPITDRLIQDPQWSVKFQDARWVVLQR